MQNAGQRLLPHTNKRVLLMNSVDTNAVENETSVKETDDKVASPAKPRWKRLVRFAFTFIAVPYLAIMLLFIVFQRSLMYVPTQADSLKVADVGFDPKIVSDVQINTPDGETLKGWLWKTSVKADNDKPPLLIYFPGNALNRKNRVDEVQEFARAGYDVLLFDYRGYGDSTGSPSEKAMTADARLIWEYALGQPGYEEGRTVLFGESMGGAVTLSLWNEEPSEMPKGLRPGPRPKAVMLNSTFTSMGDAAAANFPMFPFRYFLLDPWPSIERIDRVPTEIVLFHGTDDTLVPVEHSRRLAKRAVAGKLIEIPNVGHNYVPTYRLREELEKIRAEMQ